MNPHWLHLIVNHVPVVGAIWVLGVLAYAVVRPDPAVIRLGLALTVLLALSAGLAFWTGEPAEEAVEHLPGVDGHTIETHEELAKVALGGAIVSGITAAVALGFARRRRGRGVVLPSLLTVAATAVLLALAAHQGGLIVRPDLRGGNVRGEPEHEAVVDP